MNRAEFDREYKKDGVRYLAGVDVAFQRRLCLRNQRNRVFQIGDGIVRVGKIAAVPQIG